MMNKMMIRQMIASAAVTCTLFLAFPACSLLAQSATPSADVDDKQQDKVLFERGMKAMKNSKYAAARTLLVTLINSYPDSELVPRAKLFIGNAWYDEGNFARAEMEYRDFITFFPHRPEVAEVKLKIDLIHNRSRTKK